MVTFRKEGVDWNGYRGKSSVPATVTFRKEGVDWNIVRFNFCNSSKTVTFRKEGVDWNVLLFNASTHFALSPSARKVWIEIVCN